MKSGYILFGQRTNNMKIYFAASIRGGREDQLLYAQIIKLLGEFGTVLTEHFGEKAITPQQGTGRNVQDIHDQDLAWVKECDVVVAEVTQPSLGVGYELAKAEEWGKNILCLFRPNSERSLSAMIAGSPKIVVREYTDTTQVPAILTEFFQTHTQQAN